VIPDKIIFLDIDGVMNRCRAAYRPDIKSEIEEIEADELFEDFAVSNLNSIVEETNCYFVISSAWRVYYDIEKLKTIFTLNGFKYSNRIIDYTPRFFSYVPRGREIKKWLEDNKFEGEFVIIDDNDDMCELKDRLVFTDSYDGLTDEKALEVKQKLPQQ
jgi:hypothetical protein